jgi:hypothetical protein
MEISTLFSSGRSLGLPPNPAVTMRLAAFFAKTFVH